LEAERVALDEESEAILASSDQSEKRLIRYRKNQDAWQDWHRRLNLLKEQDPEYVE
jgi:hypothetical protein